LTWIIGIEIAASSGSGESSRVKVRAAGTIAYFITSMLA
jgi:hypothetical protein